MVIQMATGNEWTMGIIYGVAILAVIGVFIYIMVSKIERFDAGYPTYPYKQYKAPTTLLT